jgi:hypothetical protein
VIARLRDLLASPRARTALLLAVFAALLGAGFISLRETREQLVWIEACDAAARQDYDETLALTEGRVAGDPSARDAAECRCRALQAQGREPECIELLGGIAAAAPDWTPAPDLAALAASGLADRGRVEDAARLVGRARQQRPDDLGLLSLELELRAHSEPEGRVIEALAASLPAAGDTARLGRALLAQRELRRGDAPAALRLLGEAPVGEELAGLGEQALSHWFDTVLTAHALDDDLAAAQRTRDAWIAAGQDAAVVRARYALALSIAGLQDPEVPIIPLLARSLAETRGLPEPRLREGLAIRLILTLSNAGRFDAAIATYDRLQGELDLQGLSRDELLRAARRERLAAAPPQARVGTLRFRIRDAPPGTQIWLSPEADAPADASYTRAPLPASGVWEARRREGDYPQRWVLRRDDAVLASGTLSPRAGEERSVALRAGAAVPVAPRHARQRRAADGTRRVSLVLLDCGDWRIVRYLLARGELPVFDALLREGRRAVLRSDPPLTAAALESLVWPGRHGDASLLGLVHRMGVELAGLASVGDNPFDALRLVLPESDDLFSSLGAGERSAANLLLSHGGIRAGRHGEVTGPHGARSRVPIGRAERELRPEERLRWPRLARAEAENPRDSLYLRTMAAELDATLELARDGAHDFVAVRIEPLDILTHASYADTTADARDDGERLLFSVYRYIDARLGEIDAALDEDDVLIVMSDHGIKTAMEHSPDAFFVAVGGGVPVGRVPGQPDLRGVPRALAELLGVATDWPDTGIAAFARRALAADARNTQAPVAR